MNFSYKKMLLKGIKVLVVFGLPFLVEQFVANFPVWANLSVSTALYMGLNFLKVRIGVKYL